MLHLTRRTYSCSSDNAKPLKKNRLREVLPLQIMSPAWIPQRDSYHHASFHQQVKCQPQASYHKALRYRIWAQKKHEGPATDEARHGWSRLHGSTVKLKTERAVFQSSLQLVYSLSCFDTTPVSGLAWKPPQHSRWQSVCITNVLKGQPVEVASGRGLLRVGQDGQRGPSRGATAQPSVPDFAGDTSHHVRVAWVWALSVPGSALPSDSAVQDNKNPCL